MRFAHSLLALSLALGVFSTMATAEEHDCALSFKMKSIDGKTVDLHDYKGKVVLMVNVASECGLTGQYEGLQALHEAHAKDGLVVMGFPCNQFGQQEPGSDQEIKQFCTAEFQVTFPMFSKIDVNGDNAAPLYKHLTSQDTKPDGKGKVGWNFAKFLVDKEGKVAARFAPNVAPDDAELVKAIKTALK